MSNDYDRLHPFEDYDRWLAQEPPAEPRIAPVAHCWKCGCDCTPGIPYECRCQCPICGCWQKKER